MKCSVYCCRNNRRTTRGKSFFRFPRDKEICEEWVAAIGRPGFIPSDHCNVCEDHFIKDFLKIGKFRKNLRSDGVPFHEAETCDKCLECIDQTSNLLTVSEESKDTRSHDEVAARGDKSEQMLSSPSNVYCDQKTALNKQDSLATLECTMDQVTMPVDYTGVRGEMPGCYLCGEKEVMKQEKIQNCQSRILRSFFHDLVTDEQLPVTEKDFLCLPCNTVLLHAEHLEREFGLFRNLLRRQFTKKNQSSEDSEEKWLLIDHEALANFNVRKNIYYCLECSFQTTLFEQLSVHYKFHCITQSSAQIEAKQETEIELPNSDNDINNDKDQSPGTQDDNSSFITLNKNEDVNNKIIESKLEEIASENEFEYENKLQEEVIKCSLCNFSSTSVRTLKLHMNKQHVYRGNSRNNRNHRVYKRKGQLESEKVTESSVAPLGSSEIKYQPQNENVLQEPEDDFICDICQKQFRSIRKLHLHIKKNHRSINVPLCEFCGFWRNGTCDHSQAILLNFPQTHCEKCDLIFYQNYLLMEHLYNVHLICRYCRKVSNSKMKLKDHESRHSRKPIYKCSWCPKAFVSKNGVKFHSSIHTGLHNFECDKCSRKFVHKKDLEEHMCKLSKKPRYICPLCGEKFIYDASYKMHRKWHDDPYPAKCKLCPKKFRHATLLAKHWRVVHERKSSEIICQFCGKKFSTRSSRRCHEMYHSGKFTHVCKVCNKGFDRKNRYELHMNRAHNNDTILKDNVACHSNVTVPPEDQNYKNSEDCHEMLHSGKFTHVCKVCNKGFDRKNRYELHMNRAHNNDTILKDNVACHSNVTVPPEDQNYKNSEDCHEMLHSGKFTHVCKVCNKGFDRKNRYELHMNRAHNNDTILKDNVACHSNVTVPPEDQNYKNSEDCHEMLHSGKFTHVCKVCNKGFDRKNRYELHMNRAHNNDTILKDNVACHSNVTVPPEDQNYKNGEDCFDNEHVHIEIKIEKQSEDLNFE